MNPSIKVRLSEDEMTGYISVENSIEKDVSATAIMDAITKSGITYGIKNEVVENITAGKLYGKELVIAEGLPPEVEGEGDLIWYIQSQTPNQPTINDSGKADFKLLHQFEEVEKGQQLVSKAPSSILKPGKSVKGEDISQLIITSQIMAGNNVSLTDDGLTLVAECDGHLFWKQNVIHVDNVYQIGGNVDFHTGNIKFKGTVIIGGDVKSGFRVEAQDDIVIEGNVEGADVISEKGDINIQAGIVGRQKARILCGGDLRCGYIQDASVGVRKNIYVDHYIINSSVNASGSIFVNENEGIIRGGKSTGGKSISAQEIGSRRSIPTDVGLTGVRGDPAENMRRELVKKIISQEEILLTLKKRKDFLILLKDKLPKLSEDKEQELVSIDEEIGIKQEKINSLTLSKSKIADSEEISEILAKKALHQDVTINIGQSRFCTEKMYPTVRVYKKDGEIIIEPIHSLN